MRLKSRLINRIFLHCSFLVLLLPVGSQAQEQDPVGQIKSYIESYQFSQAISLAEQYLSKDSTNSDLIMLKGHALAAVYQYREAIAALQRALGSDSSNVKVLKELVDVYRQSGDIQNAIAGCRNLCIMNPDNRYFGLQLANLYYSEEDYRQALQILSPLYKSDSSSFFVARQLGNCYSELRQYDSAIWFYRRALKIQPFDPYVTGKLVNAYNRDDNVAMALYTCQIFLEKNQEYVPVLKQSGYCYYLFIDFISASKQLRECIRLGDSSKFTLKYLGLAYYKQEKYDSAAPLFRAAFKTDTTDAEMCFYYGVSENRSQAIDTGMVYLKRTLRLLMPSDQFLSTLYAELAEAHTESGQPDTALILLQKALEVNPLNNTLRFKIAYQYDYCLRRPYDGLPFYREFMKNADPKEETRLNQPQQVSYSDYAKNRIREITAPRKKH